MTEKPEPGRLEDLLALMRRLRDPARGCPWDNTQTSVSIAHYAIEEAYEVVDAIERKDPAALCDELGDLLFQVVFHAQIASEAGQFSFSHVVEGIIAKMERRHPHVFGEAVIEGAAAQSVAWEAHKAAERAARGEDPDPSALAGLPVALPALTRAVKLQKRLARVGFDWDEIGGALDKLREEIGELEAELQAPDAPGAQTRIEEEFGDILSACASVSRFLNVDPETALRQANAKVERRFRAVEAALAARGLTPEDSDLAEMDRLWDAVKAAEKTA